MTAIAGRALAWFERRPLFHRLLLLSIPALAVRLLYGLALVGPTVGSDTALFYGHAQRVLAGEGYGLPDRPPAFVYALTGILAVFGNYPVSIAVYQACLSAAVPALLYLAGQNLFGERAATLAGVFAVFHYPLIDYARVVQSDVQFAFMVVLTAWALSPRAGWRRTLVGGLLLGLTVLTRGTGLAFLPFIGLLGLSQLGPAAPTRRARAGRVAGLFLAAGLVVGPWTARNAILYEAFIPVSSESGLNFFQGATASFLLTRETDLELARKLTGWDSGNNDELIRPENQGPLMDYWWRLWRERPAEHLLYRLISFLDFWSPVERLRFYTLGPGNVYWAASYGLLLPFFVLGAYLTVRRRLPGSYFCLAAIAGAMLLHTLSHAEQTRYRGMSVETLIVLVAMYGVVEYWKYRSTRILPLLPAKSEHILHASASNLKRGSTQ
jgi:4-amino-4-deoxy-L-arabinose transferase-like glycosyltransferase